MTSFKLLKNKIKGLLKKGGYLVYFFQKISFQLSFNASKKINSKNFKKE